MLLIIEALLLISAALGQDHRTAVEGQIFPLDMAPDAVDDQYNGCTKDMANLVETKLLEKERKKSAVFETAWKKGENFVKTPNDDLTRNHVIAIYVYTDALVYENFNRDTRCGKKQYTDKKYEWYSLHFLLTDAIQILKKTQNQCYSTYRGTNVEFNTDVQNKEVRFGSFVSFSLDRKVAQHFGTKSCFEIETCKGAEVTKYSKLNREKEVLIPPYEMFKVTAVKTRGEQKDPWCDTVYTLENTGTESGLNCALFKKPPKTITKYYALNKVF